MDSMEQIYIQYSKLVYVFLLAKTKTPDLAEELTQETFFQAVKNINQFQGKSSVSTWLCGIAKNVWFGYLKKHKNQDGAIMDWDIPVESVETTYFQSWTSMDVLKRLHNLGEPMREVMYLRLSGNLSFRQIGEIMGRTENWARVTFYRGKAIILRDSEGL